MTFLMLQVRKSCFCGISASFFQSCFLSETQLLINGSFQFFFLRIISWKGALLFNGGGFIFKWEVPHGWHQLCLGISKKIMRWGMPPMLPSTVGNPAGGGCIRDVVLLGVNWKRIASLNIRRVQRNKQT